MNDSATSHAGIERRRFFRIDDEVTLFFRELDEGELPEQPRQDPDQDFYLLVTAYNRLCHEITAKTRRLERSAEDIAEVLKLLNSKLDLLAKNFLIRKLDMDDKSPQAINVSAAGIAFGAGYAIQPGTLLEIKLILPSSLLAINAYGRVVRSEETLELDSAEPFQVGVDFIGLSDDEREQLVKYIVKKQMQQIRERQE